MIKNIGDTLKETRKTAGKSVKEVSMMLRSKGFRAGENTVYSWENNNSQPSPDILLILCDYYGIKDILSEFGISEAQKTPSTSEPAEGEYQEYIDLIKKLPIEQRIEVKGYLKHLVYDYEAAEATKQINKEA